MAGDTITDSDEIQWLTEVLQDSSLFTKLRKDLQREVSKSYVPLNQNDMKKSLEKYIKDSGWDITLQNAVYREIKVNPIPKLDTPDFAAKEPLQFIRKAQATWEKRIVKSINSMCTELSLPLATKRSAVEQASISSKFQTLGSDLDEKEFERIKPVYAPKDFFEALIAVENSNFVPLQKTPSSIKGWGLIQVNLYAKSLDELRCEYQELDPGLNQCGVDDAPSSSTVDVFESDWPKLGKKVIQNGSAIAARQYAKNGCPSGLRGQIWQQILCLDVDDVDLLYFNQLKTYVIQHKMLVDNLVMKDIRMTATNDDDYFVFEDLLYQALLVFTRDTAVLRHFHTTCANPPKSYIKGKLGVQEYAVLYPPNGVIPFHGFSMHAAPLCYICSHAPRLYFLFRELYTRYFFRLHTMSSHPQGIMSLCVLFERLLQTHEPSLFYHLKNVGAPPLRLVFNWIVYAFSGYLSTDQVLLLWDRILAYDSLEVLPVLAMAILSYRRCNLMEVTNLQTAQKMKTINSPNNILHQIISYLLTPCDPSNLGVFRFFFGLLMVIDIPQERGFAHIDEKWEEGMCYFTLFNFLKPMSYEWMHVLYTVMFLAAFSVMIGFLYRISCFTLMTCYWYIFFLDKGVWNNHSYLYGVISVMLLMTDCNRYWSVDGLLFPSIRNSHIPKWNYFIFKFQVVLVYFYAGIKKLDHDWMTGYSMTGLANKWVFDPFRPFMSNENIDFYLVHISGLCYDLFVGFFLLFEKTRLVGVTFSLMFHGMNSQMFSIGMFPYTMMASLTLFYSEKWPKTLLSRFPGCFSFAMPLLSEAQSSSHCVYTDEAEVTAKKDNEETTTRNTGAKSSGSHVKWSHKLMLMLFGFHVAIQCFLPYSHFLTKGYNGWTEGLYGYSWDMMVHSWSTQHIRVKVVDQSDGKEVFIRPGVFIAGGRRSHSRWSSHPDMIKQYTACLADKLKNHQDINISEPAIYLDIWRSLNQRFQQRFVDPNVNLVEAPWSPFAHSPWVLPLLTDLTPWREKMKEIEQKRLNTSMGNFTEIVFVADFPGLMLENFVSEELNTTLTVLQGRVNVEVDNANQTLGEGEEITVPSNASHVVYTVSDTPACWMYVYLNTTVFNNETLRQWVMHPETRPSSREKEQLKKKSLFDRFMEFMVNKYMIFYVTFWNSYHAIGHLTVGLEYPWEHAEHNEQPHESSLPSESVSEGQDMEHRTENTTIHEPDYVQKETIKSEL